FHFAHPPPIDCGWIAILLIASHYATLATDALRHIEVKTILFAGPQRAFRDHRSRRNLDSYSRMRPGREQSALHQRQLIQIHVSCFRHVGSFVGLRIDTLAQGKGRTFESTWESAPLG